jgi:hypothetical protein
MLKPDPKNPNRMADGDKARMAKSLEEFGDLSGIVLNRRTGLMVGGHQRADVLKNGKLEIVDLSKPEPDGTVARGHLDHGGRRYAVRVVDWPEEKAHAALLAANRFGRVGEDDSALLAELLAELDDVEIDMELTGFSQEALAELLVEELVECENDVDDDPRPPASPVSKFTFPPRVWLTQRDAIKAALSPIIESFGGTAEWAE